MAIHQNGALKRTVAEICHRRPDHGTDIPAEGTPGPARWTIGRLQTILVVEGPGEPDGNPARKSRPQGDPQIQAPAHGIDRADPKLDRPMGRRRFVKRIPFGPREGLDAGQHHNPSNTKPAFAKPARLAKAAQLSPNPAGGLRQKTDKITAKRGCTREHRNSGSSISAQATSALKGIVVKCCVVLLSVVKKPSTPTNWLPARPAAPGHPRCRDGAAGIRAGSAGRPRGPPARAVPRPGG